MRMKVLNLREAIFVKGRDAKKSSNLPFQLVQIKIHLSDLLFSNSF
jgi:hypothetical protein